jgi:hypothetical protein
MRRILIALSFAFADLIAIAAGLSAASPTQSAVVLPACDLIVNGGFEDGPGSGPWITTTIEPSGAEFIGSTITRTGRYSARLAGHGLDAEDTLAQIVTIPVTAPSAILSYAWLMTSTEPFSDPPNPHDFLTTTLRSADGVTVLRVLTEVHDQYDERVWHEVSFDVSDFAGQTIQVHFLATNDFNLQDSPTAFFIDDVSLTICYRTHLPLVTRNQ